MKLLTKAIENKMPKLGSQDQNEDPICIVKYFDPTGSWTWFAYEGERQEGGDYLFFGLVKGFVEKLCELGSYSCFGLQERLKRLCQLHDGSCHIMILSKHSNLKFN